VFARELELGGEGRGYMARDAEFSGVRTNWSVLKL
jgi:hypothetical protein